MFRDGDEVTPSSFEACVMCPRAIFLADKSVTFQRGFPPFRISFQVADQPIVICSESTMPVLVVAQIVEKNMNSAVKFGELRLSRLKGGRKQERAILQFC